ncbi:uncharacterized protein LOC132534048 [Erinaceus europaeus]|uniref:Uncharacterized protein LOC132534048 n=1 Tax=Erinaceus europaeus TaxID=9365 RepID=A0ABM3WAH3_ERIEU|nr:uncharacterized protein LOC132534048 [Erinaceus europaeus]
MTYGAYNVGRDLPIPQISDNLATYALWPSLLLVEEISKGLCPFFTRLFCCFWNIYLWTTLWFPPNASPHELAFRCGARGFGRGLPPRCSASESRAAGMAGRAAAHPGSYTGALWPAPSARLAHPPFCYEVWTDPGPPGDLGLPAETGPPGRDPQFGSEVRKARIQRDSCRDRYLQFLELKLRKKPPLDNAFPKRLRQYRSKLVFKMTCLRNKSFPPCVLKTMFTYVFKVW